MSLRWAGPLIAVLILGAVAAVLLLNLEARDGNGQIPSSSDPAAPGPPPVLTTGGVVEIPIGDTERNHMVIAAVWLPAIHMEGMGPFDPDLIHLEADVKSAERNPNGFALGEFVPYLTIHYKIAPEGGGAPIEGPMSPMIARDGLHYGANVSLPKHGNYRLTYTIQPPSSGGLGRHDDSQTGVAPWWKPFEVGFDWKFAGIPHALKK